VSVAFLLVRWFGLVLVRFLRPRFFRSCRLALSSGAIRQTPLSPKERRGTDYGKGHVDDHGAGDNHNLWTVLFVALHFMAITTKFLAIKFLAIKFLAIKFLAIKFLAIKFLAIMSQVRSPSPSLLPFLSPGRVLCVLCRPCPACAVSCVCRVLRVPCPACAVSCLICGVALHSLTQFPLLLLQAILRSWCKLGGSGSGGAGSHCCWLRRRWYASYVVQWYAAHVVRSSVQSYAGCSDAVTYSVQQYVMCNSML
jgi:hypothetical protein